MATLTIGKEKLDINDGLDSIVNVKVNADLNGGDFLDASEWQEDVIKSGHVIIRNTTTKQCKPLDVTSGAYVTLPSGHEYFGTLRSSVSTANPQGAIVLSGVINESACPYPLTSTIKNGLKNIVFI